MSTLLEAIISKERDETTGFEVMKIVEVERNMLQKMLS